MMIYFKSHDIDILRPCGWTSQSWSSAKTYIDLTITLTTSNDEQTQNNKIDWLAITHKFIIFSLGSLFILFLICESFR